MVVAAPLTQRRTVSHALQLVRHLRTGAGLTQNPHQFLGAAPVGWSRTTYSASHALQLVRHLRTGAERVNWCGANELVRQSGGN